MINKIISISYEDIAVHMSYNFLDAADVFASLHYLSAHDDNIVKNIAAATAGSLFRRGSSTFLRQLADAIDQQPL